MAHRTSSNVIYYYEGDMLGSARTIVQAGQTTVCYDADFLPFGGERVVTNTCTQNYKFEGKKRDLETGNDDFGARYYRSNIGRWMSADWSSVPAPVPYANLTNPQTLNLYAMVSDNPETFADLDGHQCNTASTGSVPGDHNTCPGPAATKTAKQGEGNTGDGTTDSDSQNAEKAANDAKFLKQTTWAVENILTLGLLAETSAPPSEQGATVDTEATEGAATATADDLISVTHFTDDNGVAQITQADGILWGGGPEKGTFVTPTSEIPSGATAGDIESLLEIKPGRGANSITFDTPASNLAVPANGAKTSGQATQFRLVNPTKVDPFKFAKTPANIRTTPWGQ